MVPLRTNKHVCTDSHPSTLGGVGVGVVICLLHPHNSGTAGSQATS